MYKKLAYWLFSSDFFSVPILRNIEIPSHLRIKLIAVILLAQNEVFHDLFLYHGLYHMLKNSVHCVECSVLQGSKY